MVIGDHEPTENIAPVTIKGVCLDVDRRVLLCRNHRSEWELPGGRPQLAETFSACLIREIEEETGLAATVDALICAYPYEVIAGRWVNVIVYGCEISQAAVPARSVEHLSTAFVALEQIEEIALAPGYREAIGLWANLQ
jgi:8-oxo-dGTP diphosphatase